MTENNIQEQELADLRQKLLDTGMALAGRPGKLDVLAATAIAQEAGVSLQAFQDAFDDIGHFRRELLLHVMNIIRTAVLATAAGLDQPGFDRMWRTVEAYLDANLRYPAMRRLAQALRTDPTAIELLRRRISGYAMVFKVELAAMGRPNPAAAARLSAAMIVEAAVAESETGHAQPEMRRALYAFLKGYPASL